MPDEYITRAEAQILVDERIKAHDESNNEPKHTANQTAIKELVIRVNELKDMIIEMKTTQNIVMKFAGAGIIIWAIRQIVELVQSFHH